MPSINSPPRGKAQIGDHTSGLKFLRSLLMATVSFTNTKIRNYFETPGELALYGGTQTSTSGLLSMGWRFLYWRKSVGIPGKKVLLIVINFGLWMNILSLMSQLSERLLYGLSIFIIKNPREVFSSQGRF